MTLAAGLAAGGAPEGTVAGPRAGERAPASPAQAMALPPTYASSGTRDDTEDIR